MSCRLFVFNGLCLVSYVIWLELDTLAWTISVDFVSFAFFTGEAAKIYFQYSNENGSAFAVEKCDKNNHNQKLISGGSLKIYSENGKSETDMTSFKQGTSMTVFVGDWVRPDKRCPCIFYSCHLPKLMTHPIVCHFLQWKWLWNSYIRIKAWWDSWCAY